MHTGLDSGFEDSNGAALVDLTPLQYELNEHAPLCTQEPDANPLHTGA